MTLASTTRPLCNYSCRPIRLQNGLWNVSQHVVTYYTTPPSLVFSHAMADPCEAAATKALGCSELKPEQMQVVTAVLRGRDVFAVLPTGYGKTLCYAVLPAAFDALFPGSSPSIVIVLSPLTAIMKDQASIYN